MLLGPVWIRALRFGKILLFHYIQILFPFYNLVLFLCYKLFKLGSTISCLLLLPLLQNRNKNIVTTDNTCMHGENNIAFNGRLVLDPCKFIELNTIDWFDLFFLTENTIDSCGRLELLNWRSNFWLINSFTYISTVRGIKRYCFERISLNSMFLIKSLLFVLVNN